MLRMIAQPGRREISSRNVKKETANPQDNWSNQRGQDNAEA